MDRQDQVIKGFRDVLNKMISLNKSKMKNILSSYKSSEVHCIEYIELNTDSNVTKLSESFYMTRGAISKLTKKLIEKNLIESYKKPENKKEIYFKLTEQGREVYNIHKKLHDEFHERDSNIFESLTKEQFNTIIEFTTKYSLHLDKEIKKSGINIEDDFE